MKNKKALYLLLPLVLLVWAVIIYKVWVAREDQGYRPLIGNAVPQAIPETTVVPDTFSLHADYPDPFLKRKYVVRRPASSPSMKTTPAPKAPVQWPAITYYGVLSNTATKEKKVSISINGKGYIFKGRETIDGVHLVRVFKDSVWLSFQKERKTIRRN